MRVMVTGNEGFVGKETTKYLEEKKISWLGYDIMNQKDIRDLNQLEEFVKINQPERILHLAAIARFAEADNDPVVALETNSLGTKNIAYVSAKYHIPLVYASTGSVYMPVKGIPPITEDFPAAGNSLYGCTKLLGEKYIQGYNTPYIILRYAHLYGREKRMHGLVGGFLERIERGLAPILYGGRQSNDFTYIKDVARANYLAITASWDKWNQIYNIGTGEELTAEEAGKLICEATGYKGKIEIKEQRTVDPVRFVYDTKKAEQVLNFKAEFSFQKGLKDMFSSLEVKDESGQGHESVPTRVFKHRRL